MTLSLLKNKPFIQDLLRIALPITLQNLFTSSVNMVDNVMIGQLGKVPLAAVDLANQVSFLLILFLFGTSTGGGVFIAQFWGKQDIKGIRKTLGICLSTSLIAGLIFGFASFFAPEWIMRIFTLDEDVIRTGAEYLTIIAPSLPITAISFAFSVVLRSIEQVTIPLQATTLSIALNGILNYLLIFGIGPFPALGVAGAAIATTIARVIELAYLLIRIYRAKGPAAAKPSELFSFSRAFFFRFFRIALPVILNEVFWSTGMSVYHAIFARMGTDAIAAFNIMDTISRIAFVLFIGTSSACSVLIGKHLGRGEFDEARKKAGFFALASPFAGLSVGLLCLLFIPILPHIYQVPPEVISNAAGLIVIMAIIFPAKIFNLHLVVGIIRSGGDTVFGMLFDLGGVWLVGVPVTFFTGLVLGLPPVWVYAFACMEEILKLFIGIPRLRSGKWMNSVTNEDDPGTIPLSS